MLDDPQLQKVMRDIVAGRLPTVQLERILTEAATDSEGNDALRITLVLTPEAARSLTGDQVLDLLVDIHNGLLKQGEERFPIVQYATEDELREDEHQGEEAEDDG